MIIAIDFDGVLARTDYPVITGLTPYVREAMQQLHQDGHYLIVNTCREGAALVQAVNWLLAHDIPFDCVNDNRPCNIAQHGNNSRKIWADVYIDDHNLGGFPGWKKTLEIIGSPWDGCWP